MAVIKEYWQGVNGDQDRRLIRYLVTQAADDNAALDQLETDSPLFYDGMPRENISVRELSKKDELYEGTSRYTRRSFDKPAEDTNAVPINVTGPSEPTEEDPDKGLFSFDVAVQSKLEYFPEDIADAPTGQRIAIDTGLDQNAAQYEEVDLEGYNFDPAFGYRGRDLLRPTASFSLDFFPDDGKVNRTYQNLVMSLVGKVNSVSFRKNAVGEVMLVAARGESRNNADWQFSYTFEVRKNRTNVNLGNQVVFASVEGWDEIDPWYVPQQAALATKIVTVHRCRQAIVWRPYERADLGALFI